MLNVWGISSDLFGRPITKIGEMYLNFGTIGVLIGGALLGWLNATLYYKLIIIRFFGQHSYVFYVTIMSLGVFNYFGYFFQNVVYVGIKLSFLLAVLVFLSGYYKFRVKVIAK